MTVIIGLAAFLCMCIATNVDKYNSQLVSIEINRKQYVPVGMFTQPAVRYEDENGCPWELHLLKTKNVTLP